MHNTGGMIGVVSGILGFIAASAPMFTDGIGFASEMPVQSQIAAPPSRSQIQPFSPNEGLGIIGRWSGMLEGDGSMEVDPAPIGFKVALHVSGPFGCVGFIEGSGPLSGDTITLTKKKDGQDCTVTIKFKVWNKVEVSENNCSDYHGTACGFKGTLTRED